MPRWPVGSRSGFHAGLGFRVQAHENHGICMMIACSEASAACEAPGPGLDPARTKPYEHEGSGHATNLETSRASSNPTSTK